MPNKQQQLRNKERHRQIETPPLHPDFFYRLIDGHRFFGYGHSSMDAKIKSGEIPKPIRLSDTGRARGWFGRTIIAWQQEREAKADAKAR